MLILGFVFLSAGPATNTVTIGEQIARIEGQLAHRRQVRFREFLSTATSRVEIIVTLWAVLELIKQKRARVHQEELFGEILIEQESDDLRSDGPQSSDLQPNEAAAGVPATSPAT